MDAIREISQGNSAGLINRWYSEKPQFRQFVDSIQGLGLQQAAQRYGIDANQIQQYAPMFGVQPKGM